MHISQRLTSRILTIQSILIFSFLMRIFVYKAYPPLWDASVYIAMGKYIFSQGGVGFLEPFRPIFWPILLGVWWKNGFDPIVAGRIMEILFSLGNIFLVYAIGKKVYGRDTGLLAAILLSLSPVFFGWGNSLYTEVPASFFGLLAVYLFFHKQFGAAGIIGAVAFFTRFTQIVPLVLMPLIEAIYTKTFKNTRILFYILTFFLAAVPFLVLYAKLFGHAILFVEEASRIYNHPFLPWHQGLHQCLKLLWYQEGWIIFLIPLGYLTLRYIPNRKDGLTLLLICLGSLAWVGHLREYLRMTMTALPYVFLVSSHVLIKALSFPQGRYRILLKGLLMTITVILLVSQFWKTISVRFPANKPDDFQVYLQAHETNMKGKIWISSPETLVFTNLKATELIYYGFSREKIARLKEKLPEADVIFLNSQALPCEPENDTLCLREKEDLIKIIQGRFHAEYSLGDPGAPNFIGIFIRNGGLQESK